ncbi:restriction endonuclease subunit S [Rhizobium leguminosarum]|uniref:restriction endonuclease subunit S n=1 Tax=Rhizobium leguminosarum TaxID=384 RepID=UPI00103EF4E2|nr:restriction endonuclease subunit S [Rhizobium leguminosarum]TBY21458.1 restriction endonuclease subunit S [Rhizobium leguminosarum bv. viciae]TBY31061.1 restriction endonuclease subunit S [Rhizobium leguminosarum bv. viciae]
MLERLKSKSGWTPVRFDQIAKQINDRVDNPAEAGVERYVGLEHLDPNSLRIHRWGEPTDVESTKLRFQPGDIIFGKRRVYQRKVGVADFEGICSAHAMVLRAKPGAVLPEFLPFFMQSDLFMERALSISVGSLSPTINWTTLAAEEFLLPPVQEQARLVETLVASRNNVESMIALRQSLETLKLSLIFDFEERVSLADITSFSSVVQRIEAGKSPSSSGEVAGENEFGVLKVSAVGNWSYVETENKVVSESDFLRSAEVRVGDFLATRANADPDSVGRTCIVEATRAGLMLSDKTWRVILKDAASPYSAAVLAWTKSRAFRKHVRNHLNGTDAKNISQSAFLAAPFPPVDDVFVRLDGQIREVERHKKEAVNRELLATKQHSRTLGEALTQ